MTPVYLVSLGAAGTIRTVPTDSSAPQAHSGNEILPRRAWTTTPRPDGLTPLVGGRLLGVAVHYTGSSRPLGDAPTLQASARLLEAERRHHVNGRGWTDIAYSYAIDQAGRVFELRGAAYQSAANGGQPANRRYGAVTFLLGVGDRPTPALLAAWAWWRREVWLKAWPRATAVVGHRDLYATACPGDPTYQLIRAGRLAAAPADEGTSMRLHPDDIEAIARRAAELATGIGALHPVLVEDGTGDARLRDGRDIDALPTVMGEVQHELRQVRADVLAGRRDDAVILAALARIETALTVQR